MKLKKLQVTRNDTKYVHIPVDEKKPLQKEAIDTFIDMIVKHRRVRYRSIDNRYRSKIDKFILSRTTTR